MSPTIGIPEQVKQEALFESGLYYSKLIGKFVENGKIRIVSLHNKKTEELMSEFRLDEGEAAAYVLFNPKKHKAILTDDGQLIKLCKLQKIPFVCAMAALIRMHEKKKLSKMATLEKLRQLSITRRYSNELYEHFKTEVK